ncbi:MAG TPA: response regulator [Desulfuromonadales bacterium]|nr:response regulator [Desulfuromonadales bacterium]
MNEVIVIVEDEVATAEILEDYLRLESYTTHLMADGLPVVNWVREHKPALVLLDLMLPGKSGLDICKEIRSFSSVPIIMTTARVEEIDRLLGLELGADDYICKPYSPREVVARVKTVLRRVGNAPTPMEEGLLLDESCYRATLSGHDLQLTAAEFRLLNYLAAHPGRVYNRQQLLNNIYPDERALNDRAIDNYIKNLRKKINVVGNEDELIHSVYGVGYKFEKLY